MSTRFSSPSKKNKHNRVLNHGSGTYRGLLGWTGTAWAHWPLRHWAVATGRVLWPAAWSSCFCRLESGWQWHTATTHLSMSFHQYTNLGSLQTASPPRFTHSFTWSFISLDRWVQPLRIRASNSRLREPTFESCAAGWEQVTKDANITKWKHPCLCVVFCQTAILWGQQLLGWYFPKYGQSRMVETVKRWPVELNRSPLDWQLEALNTSTCKTQPSLGSFTLIYMPSEYTTSFRRASEYITSWWQRMTGSIWALEH